MFRRSAVLPLLVALLLPAAAPAAPAPLLCGDSNANGAVSIQDALNLLRKVVGLDVPVLCCGDGVRSNNEECEGSDLAGDSCVSRGFAGGSLGCSSGCSFDESGCYKSRFEDLGETVLDHETGLEWEKKTDDDGSAEPKNPHDADNLYVWGDAGDPFGPIGDAYTDFLARLNGASDGACFTDRCDWRLPTADEWMTLFVPPVACLDVICVAFFDPALEPMKQDYYWSSTTSAGTPSEAMILVVGDGLLKSDTKKELHFARAVRMGLKPKI